MDCVAAASYLYCYELAFAGEFFSSNLMVLIKKKNVDGVELNDRRTFSKSSKLSVKCR